MTAGNAPQPDRVGDNGPMEPTTPERMYYVMDLRGDRDTLRWWGPNNSGYARALELAGQYPESVIRADWNYYNNPDKSMAVPVELVRRFTATVVPVEHWHGPKGNGGLREAQELDRQPMTHERIAARNGSAWTVYDCTEKRRRPVTLAVRGEADWVLMLFADVDATPEALTASYRPRSECFDPARYDGWVAVDGGEGAPR